MTAENRKLLAFALLVAGSLGALPATARPNGAEGLPSKDFMDGSAPPPPRLPPRGPILRPPQLPAAPQLPGVPPPLQPLPTAPQLPQPLVKGGGDRN